VGGEGQKSSSSLYYSFPLMITKTDIKANIEYKFNQIISKIYQINDYLSFFISNSPYHLISKDIEVYFNEKEIVFFKIREGEFYFKKVNGKLYIKSKKYKLKPVEILDFEVENYKVKIEVGRKVKRNNKVYQRIRLVIFSEG
jgi:predicted flavoprotein YhiN